jgi:hypothetical protein
LAGPADNGKLTLMNSGKIPNNDTAGKKQGNRTVSPVTIRPFTGSDVDFVISGQLALYKSEYGFTSDIWKAYLTDGVQTFVKYFDPENDCMYILEYRGIPSGCVAITHAGAATAQLRFFFSWNLQCEDAASGTCSWTGLLIFVKRSATSGYFYGLSVRLWLHDICIAAGDSGLRTRTKIPTGVKKFWKNGGIWHYKFFNGFFWVYRSDLHFVSLASPSPAAVPLASPARPQPRRRKKFGCWGHEGKIPRGNPDSVSCV